LQRLFQQLADADRAALVERALVAEGEEIELQRLALDDPVLGRVVDDQVREIGLAGDRTERREFGAGEADRVEPILVRIGHALQHRFLRRGRDRRLMAELLQALIGLLLVRRLLWHRSELPAPHKNRRRTRPSYPRRWPGANRP